MRSAPLFLLSTLLLCAPAGAQLPVQVPGQKDAGKKSTSTPAQPGAAGGDSKNASGTGAKDAQPKEHASGKPAALAPIDPAPAPARVFARPRIGLALGGGGALALSEVGVLQWFEEHHIPVDEVAGTSMGCMVAALYSTGKSPDELKTVMNDKVFVSVFSITQTYTSRSFRRREDSRELPNGITIGLRHGISFRNAVLTDQGLNSFLDRQFLRYDDQTDFNALPIPLRCVSTDLNEATTATFARGSIPDAIRASVSLPGVYQPFTMGGHEYVDGGVLDNLPTSTIRDMQADVILAVSLPLSPVSKGDLNGILGVLQRSFSVAIEGAERAQRKLATVVLSPDLQGFGATDYLKTPELAQRGYAAAEAQRATLLPYALSDPAWSAYMAHRASLRRGPAGPVLRVRVDAPTHSATLAVQRLFAPLVNQPVDTKRIEALLDEVRSDGRYDVDYTIGYETAQQLAAQNIGAAPLPPGTANAPINTGNKPNAAQVPDKHPDQPDSPNGKAPGAPNPKPAKNSRGDQPEGTRPATPASLADISARPILLVTVADKKTGPPFLRVGVNIAAQTTAVTRATIEGVLTDQDLGGYGSELRSTIKLGYLTELSTEYFHPLHPLSTPERTFFLAPRAGVLRQPFSIYRNQVRLSDRQLQRLSVGADLGWTNQRTQEVRAGMDFAQVRWNTIIGQDGLPDFDSSTQRLRLRYAFDNQDRALVPQFGFHVIGEAGLLYATDQSPVTPQLTVRGSYAIRFGLRHHPPDAAGKSTPDAAQRHEIFLVAGEAGTMLNRDVAQPFRFTLGGPFRLSASAIDEYRGTEYFSLAPGLLRRIARLPEPLGQSIYLGGAYEVGQIRAPFTNTITRQDILFGIVAETPLGVITLAPAIGTNGERKFVFTLGKFF